MKTDTADCELIDDVRRTVHPPCSLPALAQALEENKWSMYSWARGDRPLPLSVRHDLQEIKDGKKILYRVGKEAVSPGPRRIRYVIIDPPR